MRFHCADCAVIPRPLLPRRGHIEISLALLAAGAVPDAGLTGGPYKTNPMLPTVDDIWQFICPAKDTYS